MLTGLVSAGHRARCALVWQRQGGSPAPAASPRCGSCSSATKAELRSLSSSATTPWTVGIDVVASAVLRSDATLKEDLALAAASARVLRPDDIFILLPWTRTETIDACVEAFMQVPASIHLGPQRVLDRFAKARVVAQRHASPACIWSADPLTIFRAGFVKRSFRHRRRLRPPRSCLTPLFALAIALVDQARFSAGPVLFLQRRYGLQSGGRSAS